MPQREALVMRLKRAEGQLKGIQRMIETDQPQEAVIQQISAVRAAIEKALFFALGEQLQFKMASHRNLQKKVEEHVHLLTKYGR